MEMGMCQLRVPTLHELSTEMGRCQFVCRRRAN